MSFSRFAPNSIDMLPTVMHRVYVLNHITPCLFFMQKKEDLSLYPRIYTATISKLCRKESTQKFRGTWKIFGKLGG